MSEKSVFVREYLPVNSIIPNDGQIEGLPKNPRFIRDKKYLELLASMREDPEMLELKELWVIPFDGKYIAFSGNMRHRAAKSIGIKHIPCKVVPAETPAKKLRGWAIKDNIEKGEWDYDMLANEWEHTELEEWGAAVPEWANDLDYDMLEDPQVDSIAEEMQSNVRSAIQIEFEQVDFDNAKGLVKFFRDKGIYIGGILIEALQKEKNKF